MLKNERKYFEYFRNKVCYFNAENCTCSFYVISIYPNELENWSVLSSRISGHFKSAVFHFCKSWRNEIKANFFFTPFV